MDLSDWTSTVSTTPCVPIGHVAWREEKAIIVAFAAAVSGEVGEHQCIL
jgi:hypothetical protein